MTLLESELFLKDVLNSLAVTSELLENANHASDLGTSLDEHIQRIQHAKAILEEKIKRTRGTAADYLKRQHELLTKRESKLTTRNNNLKEYIKKNVAKFNNLSYDPNNEQHKKIISDYNKSKMQHARSNRTNEIIRQANMDTIASNNGATISAGPGQVAETVMPQIDPNQLDPKTKLELLKTKIQANVRNRMIDREHAQQMVQNSNAFLRRENQNLLANGQLQQRMVSQLKKKHH